MARVVVELLTKSNEKTNKYSIKADPMLFLSFQLIKISSNISRNCEISSARNEAQLPVCTSNSRGVIKLEQNPIFSFCLYLVVACSSSNKLVSFRLFLLLFLCEKVFHS